MAKIDAFFKLMFDQGASDLHLVSGQQPILRLHGDMERVKYNVLEDGELKAMLYEIAPELKIKQYEETGDVDFGYEIPGVARFRCNFFNQKYGCGAVFRQIPTKIQTLDELGLPPLLKRAAGLNKGLLLFTGPTGSGKSTTLAAMIDHANKHRKDHVITIEDPIEYLHKDKMSVITQREIGIDTASYGTALKYVLRQNPDIILVGEMRDKETVDTAFTAAETGHLVFSTLHTANAPQTIERILEFYQEAEKERMRVLMAEFLVAVVSQRLVPKADGKGMVPNVEIMIQSPIIKKLITDNRVPKLKSAIHQARQEGMQTFDQSLVDLFNAGLINTEEARLRASKPAAWELYLKGHFPDIDTGILG